MPGSLLATGLPAVSTGGHRPPTAGGHLLEWEHASRSVIQPAFGGTTRTPVVRAVWGARVVPRSAKAGRALVGSVGQLQCSRSRADSASWSTKARRSPGDPGCLAGRRRRGILGYRERVSVRVLGGGFSDFAIVDDRQVVGALRDRRGLDGTPAGFDWVGRSVASERSLILWSTRVVLAVSCKRNLRLTDWVAARRQGG
jgi:hypothetical protein